MGGRAGADSEVLEAEEIVRRVVDLVARRLPGASSECRPERRGCSGRRWRIPCIVTVNVLLDTLKIGVAYAASPGEAAALAGARTDLGLDRLIVLVDGSVDPGLRDSLAAVGVKVMSLKEALEKLGALEYYEERVEAYTIKPAVTEGDVERLAARYRGRLFKRGDYAGHAIVYLPLYTFETRLHRVNYTEAALEALEVYLSFEAIRGSLVRAGGDGTLELHHEWQRIGELDYSALEVLEYIDREGLASYEDLLAHFGDEKIEGVLNLLVELRLVDEIESGSYTVRPLDLHGYRSVYLTHKDRLEKERPPARQVLPAEAPYPLIRAFVSLFGEVREEMVIYYPILVIAYSRSREGRVTYVYTLVDGVTGERVTDIEDIVYSSERSMEVIDANMRRE